MKPGASELAGSFREGFQRGVAGASPVTPSQPRPNRSARPRSKRQFPGWVKYPLLAVLVAVIGFFGSGIVYGVYMAITATPEQRALWAQQRADRQLADAVKNGATVTLTTGADACESIDAYETERKTGSDACFALPVGSEVDFADDAFKQTDSYWRVKLPVSEDLGSDGVFLIAKTDAQFSVTEPPKLERGQFRVAAHDYGDEWPFEGYSSGIVTCRTQQFGSDDGYHQDRPVVTIRLGQTTYGLNGAAIGVGDYLDHKPLRKMDQWGNHSVGADPIGDWIKKAQADCSGAVSGQVASKMDEDHRKGFHCLSRWDGSLDELVAQVKQAMGDPKSFEHAETRVAPVDSKGLHDLGNSEGYLPQRQLRSGKLGRRVAPLTYTSMARTDV